MHKHQYRQRRGALRREHVHHQAVLVASSVLRALDAVRGFEDPVPARRWYWGLGKETNRKGPVLLRHLTRCRLAP